ncbi:DeoR/GlpR family DNA-binding transcription regulator [Paenibacillus sp. KQZ6P-2]|uniref:DeoR/GlpR family DNA-binding transcription regulator n=1 Tax=Paenibacillus mangrovi TaxID=2931978 RepID=A0A9X2B4P3_9BACL|nr:DeoR/GlpR family DNA-binding transcription regulator [Paenibacillus mangrovi]MCJ8014190.1 DeoR/GlpR family DNA-binding transcription regulator [Paenibacillus mangrovi]
MQRRAEILKLIKENGFKRVSELKDIFQVSEVTIRSDLRMLQEEGKIERNYGGAMMKEELETPSFSETSMLLSEPKAAIAQAAVELIQPGDSLFLDGSSTTLLLAKLARNIENITIISNSIPIFEQLKEITTATLIGIPGSLNPRTQTFVGPYAEKMINDLRATKTFISPKGVLLEGLRDITMVEADIRKRMMDSGNEVIVLADHSKFNNNRTLIPIDSFDAVHTIITDQRPDEAFMSIFAEKNIRVIVADTHDD